MSNPRTIEAQQASRFYSGRNASTGGQAYRRKLEREKRDRKIDEVLGSVDDFSDWEEESCE